MNTRIFAGSLRRWIQVLVSFSIILNLIKWKLTRVDFVDFVQRTMLHGELQNRSFRNSRALEKAKEQYDKQNTVCDNLRTERSIIDEYVELIHEDIAAS